MSASVFPRDNFSSMYEECHVSGCWLWLGKPDSRKGYGRLSLANKTRVMAHRFSYEMHIGPIPKDLFVCHSCDNPRCVNPGHLFVGTNHDNVQDKISKNRQPRGAEISTCILTESQVREIRSHRPRHGLRPFLAEKYGVSQRTIKAIRRMETWAWVK